MISDIDICKSEEKRRDVVKRSIKGLEGKGKIVISKEEKVGRTTTFFLSEEDAAIVVEQLNKWNPVSKEQKKLNRLEYNKQPRVRYRYHAQSAKDRGVDFFLSFDEWWGLWEPHWDSRGRGKDKLCMCRYGDVGPYAVGNVYIASNLHNNETVNGVSGRYDSAAIITQEIADEIREELKKGYTCRELAERYPLSRQAITCIKFNRTWKRD